MKEGDAAAAAYCCVFHKTRDKVGIYVKQDAFWDGFFRE